MALSNICLFLGEEKYIINSKINRIIKETKADEFNITSYDCEETNVSNAIQDALTPPFMSDTKVVLIKRPLFLTNEKSPISHDLKLLNSYIESPLDTTYLIIDASLLKLNEKNETVKLLRKKAFVSETKAIGDIEFTGWLKRQCDLENVSIKDDAIKLFVNLVGKDLINAKTEVDKLISYVGKGETITKEIVKLVCTKEIQNDIFALSNAILESNKEKTINTYLDLIASDNDVNRLINLVSKTIRESLIVNAMLKEGSKQSDVALRMKVSPNRAFYMVKNAKGIDVIKAEDYLRNLFALDFPEFEVIYKPFDMHYHKKYPFLFVFSTQKVRVLISAIILYYFLEKSSLFAYYSHYFNNCIVFARVLCAKIEKAVEA